MISQRVQFLLPTADNEITGIQNHVLLTLIFFPSHSIFLEASRNDLNKLN